MIFVHSGILKALRNLGYDKYVFASSNIPGNNAMKIAGQEAASKLVTQAITPNGRGNTPQLDELISKSQSKYGNDVPLYFDTAQMLQILVEVIKNAQSIDPIVVKEKWESMDGQTVHGLIGPASICGTKTFGIKGHGLATAHPSLIIEDGKVTGFRTNDSSLILFLLKSFRT